MAQSQSYCLDAVVQSLIPGMVETFDFLLGLEIGEDSGEEPQSRVSTPKYICIMIWIY